MAIPQRPFGQAGFSVSALGFGAGHVGRHDLDDAEAGRLLNTALDLGITFFDTAPGYGLSEERIGRHLAHRRAEFVLASKCGYGVEGVPDWTPECVTQGIERALRVMRTDYLDVMLFHSCPRHVLESPGLIDALEAAVRAGKVRVAGYSGENEPLWVAYETGRFGALECSVNLFDQRAAQDLLPRAAERGLGVIAKRPLANAPWRFAERPTGDYAEAYWARMKEMALAPGPDGWDDLALRFAAYTPGVSSAIAGTSSLAHLRHNAAIAARGPLDRETAEAVRRAFATHDRDWIGQI